MKGNVVEVSGSESLTSICSRTASRPTVYSATYWSSATLTQSHPNTVKSPKILKVRVPGEVKEGYLIN